ncbi:MAG: hypothetical protein ACNS60_18365 [Candidatus Cyclobacteriaceae bacterium M2_1C_046]
MRKSSPELILYIRNAARKISETDAYQWGHMGACNCGFLAQEITKLTKADIHRRAMLRHGDWNEQVDDYCPTSGLPMDELISELLNAGLDREDLKKLENLSDPFVLQQLSEDKKYLAHNKKDDVVLYMNTWADLLEKNLLKNINLKDLKLKNTKDKELKLLIN